MFHSRLLAGLGWILCVVRSLIDYVEFLVRLQRNHMRHIDAPFLLQDYRLGRRLEGLSPRPSATYTTTLAKPPLCARHHFLRNSGSRMCLRTVWIE